MSRFDDFKAYSDNALVSQVYEAQTAAFLAAHPNTLVYEEDKGKFAIKNFIQDDHLIRQDKTYLHLRIESDEFDKDKKKHGRYYAYGAESIFMKDYRHGVPHGVDMQLMVVPGDSKNPFAIQHIMHNGKDGRAQGMGLSLCYFMKDPARKEDIHKEWYHWHDRPKSKQEFARLSFIEEAKQFKFGNLRRYLFNSNHADVLLAEQRQKVLEEACDIKTTVNGWALEKQ